MISELVHLVNRDKFATIGAVRPGSDPAEIATRGHTEGFGERFAMAVTRSFVNRIIKPNLSSGTASRPNYRRIRGKIGTNS